MEPVKRTLPPVHWPVILGVAGAKLLFHLLTNVSYGFHRDEFLYLALGRHPGWGHWSNPPMIGWVSSFVQTILGDSLFAVHLIPALLGSALVVLTGLTARELGGDRQAQLLAAVSLALSSAYMRSSWLFQPVIFDIFFWSLFAYWLIRYLNSEDRRFLYYLAITTGLGFLNKYSMAICLAGLLPALLLTRWRRLFGLRDAWLAAGLALLIALPNLFWQYYYRFPVVSHFEGLVNNQFVNVTAGDFLVSQFLMNISTVLVWPAGLLFLFRHGGGRYRVLGWHFLAVVLIFLLLRGKAYYTLGLYPALLAAGSVWWAGLLRRWWAIGLFSAAMLSVTLIFLPLGVPLLSLDRMVDYCRWLREEAGIDGPVRWEDGELYPLPQDYADMLGWRELANQVIAVYEQVEDPAGCMIYCENYGQAGAVEYYGREAGLPRVVSFSDTYRMWAPETAKIHTLIYVNDELGENVQPLFGKAEVFEGVTHPYARENGTTVYLLQEPTADFDAFYRDFTRPIFAGFGRE